ncbi:MAG: ABC transporter permease subunit [Promethearchaeota archaeon]
MSEKLRAYSRTTLSRTRSLSESVMGESRRKELRHYFYLYKQSLLFIVGSVLIVSVVGLALFAPILHTVGIVPFLENDLHFEQRLLPPMTLDNRTYGYWDVETNYISPSAQGNVRITSGSLHGNGLPDLIFGTEDGTLHLAENEGDITAASFKTSEPLLINNIASSPMKVDGSAQPWLVDINGDTLLDLIIGTENGSVYYSENIGNNDFPIWDVLQVLRLDDFYNSPIQVSSKASPSLFDIDQDNDFDMVIGSGNGTLSFYVNIGNNTHWTWEHIPSFGISFADPYLKENGFTSPVYPTYTRIAERESNYENLVIATSIEGTPKLIFLEASAINLVTKAYIQIASTISIGLPEEELYPGVQAVTLIDLDNNTRPDMLYFDQDGNLYELFQLYTVDGRLHLMGLDSDGGDIFSRCIWALRLDLTMSLWIVATTLIIGLFFGCIAGYFGGKVDMVISRVVDVFYAFPSIILAIAVASVLGRNMFNLGLALIVVWWVGYTRLIRGQVLLEKEKTYIEAARAQGYSDLRILFKHVLPNCWYPIMVAATLDLGSVILSLAGLSFIGFGAPIGTAELGRMISDGRQYFPAIPYLTLFPGIFIFLTVMGWNLLGDGLRDVLDPKLRR